MKLKKKNNKKKPHTHTHIVLKSISLLLWFGTRTPWNTTAWRWACPVHPNPSQSCGSVSVGLRSRRATASGDTATHGHPCLHWALPASCQPGACRFLELCTGRLFTPNPSQPRCSWWLAPWAGVGGSALKGLTAFVVPHRELRPK